MNYAGEQQQQQQQHHNHIDNSFTPTDVINNCNSSSGIDDLNNYYYLGGDDASSLVPETNGNRLNSSSANCHHIYSQQAPLAQSSSSPSSSSSSSSSPPPQVTCSDTFLKLYPDSTDGFGIDCQQQTTQAHQTSTIENRVKPEHVNNNSIHDDMFNFGSTNVSCPGFQSDYSTRQFQCLSPGSAAAAWLAQDEALKSRQLNNSDTLATTTTGSTNSANGSTNLTGSPTFGISEQKQNQSAYLFHNPTIKSECTLSSLLSQQQQHQAIQSAEVLGSQVENIGQVQGDVNLEYPPSSLSEHVYPQSSPPASLHDLVSMIGLPQSSQLPPSSCRLQQQQQQQYYHQSSPSSALAYSLSPSFDRGGFAYTYPRFPNTGDFAHKIQYKHNGSSNEHVMGTNSFDQDAYAFYNDSTCLGNLQNGISYERQSTVNNNGILLPLAQPKDDESSPPESRHSKGSTGSFNDSLSQIFSAVSAGEAAEGVPDLAQDLSSLGEFGINSDHADIDMSAAMLDIATTSSSHSPEMIGCDIHSGGSASGGSSGGGGGRGGSIRSTRSSGRIIKTGSSGSMTSKKRKSPSSKNSTGKGTTTILPAPSFVNESGSSKGSFGLMNFRRPGAWTRRPSGSVKKPFVYYDKEEER